VRHLFVSGEMLGPIIASMQNLRLYLWLMRQARTQIMAGTFHTWKNQMVQHLMQKL
jgi:queuine tRNA-ribosyltransferase